MGISDFYDVLKEVCPEVLLTVKMQELAGSRVAIDISIFLYKYVRSAGPERWMDSFIILLCTLKKYGMKVVCIFDGPNPPIEKKKEQDSRRALLAKQIQKLNYAKKLKDKVDSQFIPEDKPLTTEFKKEIKNLLFSKRSKDTTNYADAYDVSMSLGSAIDKWTRQTMPITDDYRIKATELVEAMGLSYFRAEGEAETLCAYLALHGYVDYVFSEDTDVLAYGTPALLSKFDPAKETVTYLSMENILECLELEYESFRDMCIMLSCDYNNRAKGYPLDGRKRKKQVSIGAKSVYPIIRKYKSIEEAEEAGILTDTDPLIYPRCRELFTIPRKVASISIPFTTEINKQMLETILKQNKCRVKADYICEQWKPMRIIFEESAEDILERELDEVESDDE